MTSRSKACLDQTEEIEGGGTGRDSQWGAVERVGGVRRIKVDEKHKDIGLMPSLLM